MHTYASYIVCMLHGEIINHVHKITTCNRDCSYLCQLKDISKNLFLGGKEV